MTGTRTNKSAGFVLATLAAAVFVSLRYARDNTPLFAPYIHTGAARLHEFVVIWLIATLLVTTLLLILYRSAPAAVRLFYLRTAFFAAGVLGCLGPLPAVLAYTQYTSWLYTPRFTVPPCDPSGGTNLAMIAAVAGLFIVVSLHFTLSPGELRDWCAYFPELAGVAVGARAAALRAAAWRSGLTWVTLVWTTAATALAVILRFHGPKDGTHYWMALGLYGMGQVLWLEAFRGRVRHLMRLRLAPHPDDAAAQPGCS